MNKIVEELKNVGTFYIATLENDQPRVRPFSSVTEFEGNIYLCSGNQKEVYKQIMNNPKIELCGMSKDGEWIRVSAIAVKDERIEAQEAMLKDPTGPSQLYTAGDGKFVVFRLDNVKCMKYNFYSAPREIK